MDFKINKNEIIEIKENERIDDLQCNGLKIIQNTEGFCFGVDAVLLANFADVKKGSKVVDLGTGTGIIPILIAGKTEARSVSGLEIQKGMVEMAKRSIAMNSLEGRVEIIEGDIKRSLEIFSRGSFDVVTTNPPYMNNGGGLVNPDEMKAVSRHEVLCTLEDVVKAAASLLRQGGQFAMIHRPERLVDIVCCMRKYAIEPKFIRFVHPSPYKKANLLLIKRNKGESQGQRYR